MPFTKKESKSEKKFTHQGSEIIYRIIGQRSELEINGKVLTLRFLDNGRPYTSEYVNAMATDVEDYARKFIDFHKAQKAQWEDLAKKTKREVE